MNQRPDMLAIIICHGKAAPAIERHRPYWHECFDRLIFVSPRDDYFPGSIPIGTSEHHGASSVERLMFCAVLASRFPFACVMEYDCVTFRRVPTTAIQSGAVLCSHVFQNEDPVFAADTYAHGPWLTTGETWWHLVQVGANMQHGYPDRWLAYACQNSHTKLLTVPHGFSDDKPWTEDTRALANKARRDGAVWVHGCKSALDFSALIA